MKTKEIAQKYGINQEKFEHFLQAKHLNFKKSLFSSLSVNDSDVDSYVRSFNEFQAKIEAKRKAEEEAKRKAEAEAKRKAEEEAKRKAEEEAKRKAEKEARRKAEEEAKRKAEAEAKRKAEEEAKRKAEEEARRKAEEEARKKQEAQQRNERIRIAETEFLERDAEEKDNFNTETEEGRNEFMANCVKLYKEKLKGTWNQNGASYADGDILGLWLQSFTYSEDGEVQTGTNRTVGNFNYSVCLTGDESGKCMLYVKGNPNGFCSTLGEIAFTEDNNHFTLNCRNSCFFFERA